MEHLSIEEQIQKMPTAPGVYLMKDRDGTILYVGKAKNLRNRVRTYFVKSGDSRQSLRFLLPKVKRVDTLVTDTEKEALLLEDTLIKKHRPRHNIDFKDDKSYFSLKLNPREEFPKISLVRSKGKRENGARYFGPFASGRAVKETLRFLQQIFPLRTCREANFRNRSRPCLNHQIRKCLAPCCGLVSPEKYAEITEQAVLFLEGKDSQLVKVLKERMLAASEAMEYEEAARIRDQIRAVEQTLEKQKAASPSAADQDAFAFHHRGEVWEFQVLFFRRGLLVGNRSFSFSRLNLPEEEALSSFLHRYYAPEEQYIPREVLLPLPVEDGELLADWLSERRGVKVEVFCPHRGTKRELVEMARKNAEHAFQKRVTEKEDLRLTLEELKKKLRLPNTPRRVECFDISNLFGTLAVGSMASFLDGRRDPSRFRHYKLPAPALADDYALMYQVLKRRYGKLEKENAPDLLVVDGGKGQLNVALAVFQELGIQGIGAVGLAKEKDGEFRRQGRPFADKVYLPNVKDPILLPAHSAALHFLQRIRDEAHRFAVTYHRKLRGRRGLETILGEVPGIGKIKSRALLKVFGSLDALREASPEALLQVPPLSRRDVQALFSFFHPEDSRDGAAPAAGGDQNGTA